MEEEKASVDGSEILQNPLMLVVSSNFSRRAFNFSGQLAVLMCSSDDVTIKSVCFYNFCQIT